MHHWLVSQLKKMLTNPVWVKINFAITIPSFECSFFYIKKVTVAVAEGCVCVVCVERKINIEQQSKNPVTSPKNCSNLVKLVPRGWPPVGTKPWICYSYCCVAFLRKIVAIGRTFRSRRCSDRNPFCGQIEMMMACLRPRSSWSSSRARRKWPGETRWRRNNRFHQHIQLQISSLINF